VQLPVIFDTHLGPLPATFNCHCCCCWFLGELHSSMMLSWNVYRCWESDTNLQTLLQGLLQSPDSVTVLLLLLLL